MRPDELQQLLETLRALPREAEWVEFKHNKADPREIGEQVSALSNGAALHRQSRTFLLWGVDDGSHELLGTTFQPRACKVGNEELENWLLRLLNPRIEFRIHEGDVDGRPVVLFEIQPASYQPVSFSGMEYIRVGSYTKKLKDFPEKERALWALFSETPFEERLAAQSVSSGDVLDLIDYVGCFRLLGITRPDNRRTILERLAVEKVIVPKADDRFDITNVGAVLFATDLRRFDRLARKVPRVVIYEDDNRTRTIKEHPDSNADTPHLGYATGFKALIAWIGDQLPQNEELGQALRRQVRVYPEAAIRELVPNALIHQDFNLTGTGPMIEVFSDRMEITSPGVPLIDTLRFIDEPPRSRNEMLAGMMRRMNICEERGSGIDKVIAVVEEYQLPAPDFRATPQHTVVVLFAPRDFVAMDRQDRIRACYQHACLCYVSGKQMTNATLRQRLRIEKRNYPLASRIIRDSIDAKLIRQAGGTTKDARYVPFWA
ncbi:MAG: putative DNA binding domain-containing protein [Candidatus Eisenbacteria sp.]|nr:putative DNA binding domain-containing protein [Candidatus Eisenbacteria bacterium]